MWRICEDQVAGVVNIKTWERGRPRKDTIREMTSYIPILLFKLTKEEVHQFL